MHTKEENAPVSNSQCAPYYSAATTPYNISLNIMTDNNIKSTLTIPDLSSTY